MNVSQAAEILRVQIDADASTIKQAWRRAASRAHPDRGGSNQEMQMVNAAYEYLSERSVADRRAEWAAIREEQEKERRRAEEAQQERARRARAQQEQQEAQQKRSWRSSEQSKSQKGDNHQGNSRHQYQEPHGPQFHWRSSSESAQPKPSWQGASVTVPRAYHGMLRKVSVLLGRTCLRIREVSVYALTAIIVALFLGTLRMLLWILRFLARVALLAGAVWGWLHLETWLFHHATWSWPWWIGVVGAWAGVVFFFKASVPYVLHGWERVVMHLEED